MLPSFTWRVPLYRDTQFQPSLSHITPNLHEHHENCGIAKRRDQFLLNDIASASGDGIYIRRSGCQAFKRFCACKSPNQCKEEYDEARNNPKLVGFLFDEDQPPWRCDQHD